MRIHVFVAALVAIGAGCGGDEDDRSTIVAAWTIEGGDCASTSVETVRISWSENGGAEQSKDFACSDTSGELANISGPGSTFAIGAEGLDSGGVARVESYGQTASFPDGAIIGTLDITLYPKASNVIVTWNGCPTGVVLPYFISIHTPGDGTELGAQVAEVQEGCQSGMATLERVAPGDYVVQVDSRAVTPAVRGTAEVTVVAGEDVTANVDVP